MVFWRYLTLPPNRVCGDVPYPLEGLVAKSPFHAHRICCDVLPTPKGSEAMYPAGTEGMLAMSTTQPKGFVGDVPVPESYDDHIPLTPNGTLAMDPPSKHTVENDTSIKAYVTTLS